MKTSAAVRKLLASAREAGSPATLIFRLENADGLSPEEVRETSDALVAKATTASGEQPLRLKVLANLGCLTVSAPTAFLEALAGSPQIASAQRADAGVDPIAPVRRGPPNAKGWA